ncbi:MAG: hypothetical protein ACOC8N_09555, partial [Spirochaetota bacterium]
MRARALVWLLPLLMAAGVLLPVRPAAARVWWDFPRTIAESTEAEQLFGLRVVRWRGRFYLFMLARGSRRASIRYYRSEDLGSFQGPATAVADIPVEPGFYPGYDVLARDRGLVLAWNTPDGSLHLAGSGDGETWELRREAIRTGEFSFDPRLFDAGGRILLFYHTESEGRRIDFFYTGLRRLDGSWSEPRRVAAGFAGSFFPSLLEDHQRLWIAWQSRPLSGAEAPMFHVYLSSAPGPEGPWSHPVNLTGPEQEQGAGGGEGSLRGEDMRPVLVRRPAGMALFWESNRDGAWGVYYRELDGRGKPLAPATKVNSVPANARNPRPLELDGRLHVFFTDERDGTPRLYHARKEGDGFRELGPVPGGEHLIELQPLAAGGELYAAWLGGGAVGISGPDRAVRSPEVRSTGHGYIGTRGITLSWKEPEDLSGIAGYGYLFTRSPDDRPLLLNLEPDQTSVRLEPDREGAWYFHLVARDRAGNESETVTVPFTVDLTPPPAPVIDPV